MITHIALISSNGSYLVAEGGGGLEVLANRDGIGPWETFCLFNRTRPGQQLSHGDLIVLQAWHGQFVSAIGGGGGAINAELGWIEGSTTFTLEKISGSGIVRSGDQVALRAANGNYVVAEGGGGGVINANRARRDLWETFTVKIFQPQLIRLRSSSNRYVTAEGGGGGEVTANREGVGLWETFSLINHSRSDRGIYNGDSIALSAWNTNHVRTAGSSVDCRSNRATPEAIFTVVTSSEGEVRHGQRFSLQSQWTSRFLAARAGVLVADSSSITDESKFTIEFAEQAAIDFGWIPDGTAFPDRPFSSAPPRVSGEHNLLIMHFYDDSGTLPLMASNDQIHDAIFGPAPSLASWLQAMTRGAVRVSGSVYGPIRLTSSVPSASMSDLLTAAENAGVPLSSFTDEDGLIDNTRVKLIKLGRGAGAQNTPANGESRRGIRFSGTVLGVGVSPDVNEGSRMVLAHEISHLLFNVADRYGQRRPIRGDVVADRTWVGDWERFIIERVSGPGPVLDGDQIMLRAHNELYVAVDSGPASVLLQPDLINTEGPEAGEVRLFTIVNLSGGDLVNGARVALRSNAGLYVTAVLGGNSVLIANAPWMREWESFEISKLSGSESGISSGNTVSLRTSGGFYVVAETNSRDRPRDPMVDERDKQRGYIWGVGAGQGGRFDNSSSNYSTVMLSLWDRLRLGWVRARYLTPDNRGSYQLRPFIDSRHALILFDPQRPGEWYTVENRQHREDLDEVPSSGIVISWLCEDEGYWQWWFNRSNDPDVDAYRALYPAVISAAAQEVPPNAMTRPVVLNDDLITKRNDSGAAFTNQELVLPLGNGDPSRFHLSFHSEDGVNITLCIR